MGLGTKNRLLQVSSLCRDHLREKYADQKALVEEYIAEIEGAEGDTASAWMQFTDVKRSNAEMLQRLESAFEKWLCGEV